MVEMDNTLSLGHMLAGLGPDLFASVRVSYESGAVLRCIAFKEWLLPSSTPHPDNIEAFFVRGRSKSEIPVGSVVKVTQT